MHETDQGVKGTLDARVAARWCYGALGVSKRHVDHFLVLLGNKSRLYVGRVVKPKRQVRCEPYMLGSSLPGNIA